VPRPGLKASSSKRKTLGKYGAPLDDDDDDDLSNQLATSDEDEDARDDDSNDDFIGRGTFTPNS
jgi:hypothetical protein